MPGIHYKQVIVPVDGSDSAERAAAFAANLAYCCEGSMVLLFVIPDSATPVVALRGQPGAAPTIHPTEREVEAAKAQAAQSVFKKARAAMGMVRRAMATANVQIQEVVLHGDPAESIIAYAEEHSDAMIVMGSRGLSRVRGLLLGSVSDKVVHHASCPVTIVR